MPALKKKPTLALYAPLMGAAALALALAAVFYFRLEAQSDELGEKIKSLEQTLEETSKVHAGELGKWENMNSAVSIEHALARHGVTMVWPNSHATVRLPDPAAFHALRDGSEKQAEGRIARAPFGVARALND